jgi:hypothetical protein
VRNGFRYHQRLTPVWLIVIALALYIIRKASPVYRDLQRAVSCIFLPKEAVSRKDDGTKGNKSRPRNYVRSSMFIVCL